jgi:hypothetical protein
MPIHALSKNAIVPGANKTTTVCFSICVVLSLSRGSNLGYIKKLWS